jgi:hypothetical protein
MPHFDYKILTLPLNSGATEYMLNELGNEGWDLVTVDFDTRRYIFKKIRFHEINKTENQNSSNERQRT